MAGRPKRRAKRKEIEAECRALAVIPPPPPEPEETDRWGRPTSFKRGWLPMIRDMCADGATDKEIAAALGVGRTTLYEWRIAHPELATVMQFGKELADDRMERTAYELAMGYVMTVTETVKLKDARGNEYIKEVEREVRVPPDGKMLQWMLKNRRPDVWRDKTEQVVSGEVIHLTAEQARERLRAKLELLREGTVQQATG